MSPFDRAHMTSCWHSIVTMALSRVVSELFDFDKCHDLEIRVRGYSRSLKVVPYDILVIISYQCSIVGPCPQDAPSWRYSTCKYTVTLKPGLGSLKVIENDTIRSSTQDFLLTFHSNHEPISYHFRDKRRFPSKIANFPTSVYLTPPLKGFLLELGISQGVKKLE